VPNELMRFHWGNPRLYADRSEATEYQDKHLSLVGYRLPGK